MCLPYLDDIIIFSKTFEKYIVRLDTVFQRLTTANIKLKLSKCVFCANSVEYLGHIVSSEGIKPDPKKLLRVKDMKQLANVSEVRAFVGLCSYYRRFVKNFAQLAQPLTALLKKDTPFVWG